MKDIIKKELLFIVATIVLLITITIVFIQSIIATDFHFGYALDDAYIHMAIAKNFVKYGVWGVDRYSFSSATSSPLWTLLISIFYFFTGTNIFIPFVLNIILAFVIIIESYIILKKIKNDPLFIFLTLLAIIFFTPLVPLIFSGMEHLLHISLIVPFLYLSSEIIGENNSKILFSKKEKIFLLLLPLLSATRYESLFIIFGIVLLLLLKRQIKLAVFVIMLSFLPVFIYGIISVRQGWHFLPNSLLLKGNTTQGFSLKSIFSLFDIYGILNKSGTLTSLLKICLLIFIVSKISYGFKKYSILFIISAISIYLHLKFARTGSFGRYESYLIYIGIITIANGVFELLGSDSFISKIYKIKNIRLSHIALLIFIITFSKGFVVRGLSLLKNTSLAVKNIYEQQYQMGLFLREYYNGATVAANDIGAINYLADINCLDLWGLASLEVAECKLNNQYSTQKILEIAQDKKVKIAIVYDSWFREYGGLPLQWKLVGQWKILDNRVCGDDVVSFYAVDSGEYENLIKNLSLFSSRLPPDVINNFLKK